jgi:hypothetical protein
VANFREDVPLDPNWEYYDELSKKGIRHLLTARDNGRLAGYYLSTVLYHPHYKTTLFSFVDVYFLLPEYRNAANGLRLFDEYEKAMKSLNVKVMVGRERLGHSPFLPRLGWTAAETALVKLNG